ncbi:uncharacterized protein LOC143236135 [Tachypleus tridentatus]|uniref:uncharacterized protein LOC143236135 n=1 Tax=Tachypleus tridentatus TaxID=6853 RepID=UPI003FD50187
MRNCGKVRPLEEEINYSKDDDRCGQQLVTAECNRKMSRKCTFDSQNKTLSEMENLRSTTDAIYQFCKLMRPTYFVLRLFGLFVLDRGVIQSSDVDEPFNIYLKNGESRKWKLYGVFVLTILWTGFLRSVVAFGISGESSFFFMGDGLLLIGGNIFFNRITVCGWFLYCAVSSTFFYVFFSRYSFQIKYLVLWTRSLVCEENRYEIIKTKIRLWQWIVLILSFMYILFNTVGQFTFYMVNVNDDERLKDIFFRWLPFNLVLSLYASGAWSLTVSWFVLLCLKISRAFQHVAKQINDCYSEEHSFENPCFSVIRVEIKRHHILCELVEHVNIYIQYIIFTAYAVIIPTLCFLLYQLIWETMALEMKFVVAFWLITNTCFIAVISLLAAAIASEAHKPYLQVHKLAMTFVPPEHQLAVLMFSERLAGPTIGLTCLDLFVVTKTAILSIFSVLVTYFVILVQFQGTSRQ